MDTAELSNSQQSMTEQQRHRARQHVDRLIRWNRRRTADRLASVVGHPVRSVGIVGAGMMGVSIAAATARRKLPVVITDCSAEMLSQAEQKIVAEMRAGEATAQRGAEPDREVRMAELRKRLTVTADLGEVAQCDLVVESIVENAEAKRRVLADLDSRCARRTVLASNTSTIPLKQLGATLADPGRLAGIHFFCPVAGRPLVEIVRGPGTTDRTLATAVGYVEAIGKIPLLVSDGPGFLVNRLLMPYIGEAMQLLLDGATIQQVEHAATGFGMPVGPFSALDRIGLDTSLHGGLQLARAFADTAPSSPLLVALIKAGRLGCKTRAGFFAYQESEGGTLLGRPDPAVDEIIARWSRATTEPDNRTITARLFLPVVLEATRMLNDRNACHPESIDLGMLLGLGFPAWRGGLLYWADTLGASRIVQMLRSLEHLHPRLEPTPLILQMADSGGRFFEHEPSVGLPTLGEETLLGEETVLGEESLPEEKRLLTDGAHPLPPISYPPSASNHGSVLPG